MYQNKTSDSRGNFASPFVSILSTDVTSSQGSYQGKISTRNDVPGPCHVCGDRASGRHYGVASCEGCKSFFKRSIRGDVKYSCRFNFQACPVNVKTRSRCQFCRLQKCFRVGMRKEAIKQPEYSTTPPPLLLREYIVQSSPNPYKVPTPRYPAPQIPYVTSLVQANWLASCLEPVKYASAIDFPVKHERITAKILRHIVEWAKSLPFFINFCQSDKQSILESCWLELFILIVAQYQLLPDLARLLMLLKGRHVDKTLRQIEAEVNKCRMLNCDMVEMEYLKAIVLYNADCSNLSDEATIKRLQDEILSSMDDYMRSRYPKLSIAHLGRILLYLPRLRYVKFLIPADFIFPEITKNPDFISNFVKDVLYLPSSFRSTSAIFRNGVLP